VVFVNQKKKTYNLICLQLVEIDRGNGNSTMLRCGVEEVFAVEQRVHVGTLYSNIQVSVRNEFECVKTMEEMNCTLRVTRSHPYIEEGGVNYFCEMWRLIIEPLEATCTA